jgi:hypothetical protein
MDVSDIHKGSKCWVNKEDYLSKATHVIYIKIENVVDPSDQRKNWVAKPSCLNCADLKIGVPIEILTFNEFLTDQTLET